MKNQITNDQIQIIFGPNQIKSQINFTDMSNF